MKLKSVEELELLQAKATPLPWRKKKAPRFMAWRIDNLKRLSVATFANSDDAELLTYSANAVLPLTKRVKELEAALCDMVQLWDDNEDSKCGCLGASDDCPNPPVCELCVARALLSNKGESKV